MKKLFFSVMALAMGAIALVSCNKDDKNDEKNGGQEKYLPYEQQQKIIEQSVEGLAQTIDFKDLAGSVSTIVENVANLTSHRILWDLGLENACEKDSVFAAKFFAIKELLQSDDIDFNLEPLYFEADIMFMPNNEFGGITYPDSAVSYTGVNPDSVTLLPYINVVNHNSDRLKLNLKTMDNHVISVSLKGSNDKDVRMAWVDTKKGETKNINLPNTIDLSMTLDGKNILNAGGSLDTDFNAAVKGYYDRSAENDTTFKVSEVKVYGQNLSVNANVAIDKYAVNASAVYAARTGLKVDAKALLEGKEALAVNVNIDATLDEYINWAEYTTILSWAINPENVRSLDATAVLGGDQIKVVAALKENPFKYQEIISPVALFMGGSTPESDAIKAMIDKVNEILVGEIYFKGYDKPQAKLRVIYEEPTEKTKAVNSIFSSLIENISNSGLRIMVDTYDAEGNEVTISFNEYFGKINLQNALATLKSNFEEAFGSVIGQLLSVENTMFSKPEGEIL
jgi:hypothetical protein